MLGSFAGSAEDKLAQVAALVATLAPGASCALAADRSSIRCEGRRVDGALWVEELPVDCLATELVRHAAMRLGKATRSPEAVSDWERWASAWHTLQCRGDQAIAFADERIAQLVGEDEPAGVEVWKGIRGRIAVLQADPGAWPGRA